MQKWEYQFVAIGDETGEDRYAVLSEFYSLGQQGYELVKIHSNTAYFNRPVEIDIFSVYYEDIKYIKPVGFWERMRVWE